MFKIIKMKREVKLQKASIFFRSKVGSEAAKKAVRKNAFQSEAVREAGKTCGKNVFWSEDGEKAVWKNILNWSKVNLKKKKQLWKKTLKRFEAKSKRRSKASLTCTSLHPPLRESSSFGGAGLQTVVKTSPQSCFCRFMITACHTCGCASQVHSSLQYRQWCQVRDTLVCVFPLCSKFPTRSPSRDQYMLLLLC